MNRIDRIALLTGLGVSLALTASIYLGSSGLKHFDRAVLGYAIGSVLAAFAVGYRFAVWVQRPPSRMYFRRGFELLFRRVRTGSPLSVAQIVHPPYRRIASCGASLKSGARGDADAPPISNRRYDAARQSPQPKSLQRYKVKSLKRLSELKFARLATILDDTDRVRLCATSFAKNFVAQNFIRKRSLYRWVMHLCLSGGCTLAFAITFPLVFGWVHFESFADNAEKYRAVVFGFTAAAFDVHSATAFVAFNLLNFSAVLVAVGLIMAAIRRVTDAGERATQKFAEDLLPLWLIFGVTATGLMLTVSYKFLAGRGHAGVAVAHLLSVLALLGYIPFGKLFHMFQRVCSLCVTLYKRAGESGPRALCARCGADFASALQVGDLKIVLDQLGFNYRFATPGGEIHYQDICPACRRRLLALNQGRTLGR